MTEGAIPGGAPQVTTSVRPYSAMKDVSSVTQCSTSPTIQPCGMDGRSFSKADNLS